MKTERKIVTTDADRRASTLRTTLWKRHLASIAASTKASRPQSWAPRRVGAPRTWPSAAPG
jgi:hypothetical protein